MNFTALQISELIGGQIEGDATAQVDRPAKIEEAEVGALAFFANPKYEDWVYTTQASVLLIPADYQLKQSVSATLIRVPDVYGAVATLYAHFAKAEKKVAAVAESARIDASAKIADQAFIGDFVIIGAGAVVEAEVQLLGQVFVGENVQIGAGTLVYPGVRILKGSVIGKNCILHSNCVIGSDGFGFAPQKDGSFEKIAQLGNVVLEDDVELGANTVIDRASIGSTVIRAGAKIDNLVQIAHNVEVGNHTAIAAQVGIAGSTKIGSRVLVGGQAGFVGHIQVADGVKVQAQSGVAKTIKEDNTAWHGSPALPYMLYQKAYAVFKQLPDLFRKFHQMEREIEELKERNRDV